MSLPFADSSSEENVISSGSDSDAGFKKPSKASKSSEPTLASTRVARAASKKINYSFDSDEKSSESGEEILYDNSLVNGERDDRHKETIKLSDDSDEDVPMPRNEQSAEDLFDSFIGKKTEPEEKREEKAKSPSPSPVKKPSAEKRKREKIIISDSESDSDFSTKAKKKVTSKKGRAKKKVESDDSYEFSD